MAKKVLTIFCEPESIAKIIDHTLLKADASRKDVLKLCREARDYGFRTVCVSSSNVPLCRKALKGSGVKICSVAGFPLGSASSEAKAAEARQASRDGADEIDMVVNIGALKSGDLKYVLSDIKKVRKAVPGKTLKVIIEAGLLTRDEKIAACRLAKKAGADFVKTSTGFGSGGAEEADVALMKKVVGQKMGVKASGGIRSLDEACAMILAGASRIGTSSSVKIMAETFRKFQNGIREFLRLKNRLKK